ncbi:MAG TPA: hypothetical protein VK926_07440 [Gaiellaceae bacterium]|nr:hypothetical protein [Gaiellaceae bacterium]
MADAPWRCSECGTINEPVANSCRTCGRWPSLFDLQESVVDEVQGRPGPNEPGFEVGTFEPEAFEVEEIQEGEAEPETDVDRRRRLITSLIIPLAFVVYIVISIVFGER